MAAPTSETTPPPEVVTVAWPDVVYMVLKLVLAVAFLAVVCLNDITAVFFVGVAHLALAFVAIAIDEWRMGLWWGQTNQWHEDKSLLCSQGFILTLLALALCGLVIYFVVIDVPPEFWCSSPVGYCSTISCVCGNYFWQGYVFMFCMLLFTSFIGLRTTNLLFRYGRYNPTDRLQDSERGIELNGTSRPSQERDQASMLNGQPDQQQTKCTNDPYKFTKIAAWILRAGFVMIMVTGIFPTVAPGHRNNLRTTMTAAHLFGIIGGIVLICIGSAFFAFRFQDPWPRRALAGIDVVVLVIIAVAFLIEKQDSDMHEHDMCILLSSSERRCLRRDYDNQNTSCVWNGTSEPSGHQLPCTNPNCDFTSNAITVVLEFLLLVAAVLFFCSSILQYQARSSRV